MKRLDAMIVDCHTQNTNDHVDNSGDKKRKRSNSSSLNQSNDAVISFKPSRHSATISVSTKLSILEFRWQTNLAVCRVSTNVGVDSTLMTSFESDNLLRDQLILPLMFVNATLERRLSKLLEIIDRYTPSGN
jgi:hypothetical protein